jgi:acyl-CoA thioesterase
MWAEDHASQAIGMELVHIGPGEARMRMGITAQMVNGHGICHGGYIFSLADSAFAFACNSRNDRMVAQHCAISFLRPAKRDMVLTAAAQERSRAGRSGIYDITVAEEGGAVIAEFRGTARSLGTKFFEE